MDKVNLKEHIFTAPLTDRTIRQRKVSVMAGTVCLFIAMSETLPKSIGLIGVNFDSNQGQMAGWFLFSITLVLFIHSVTSIAIDIATWIRPFMYKSSRQKEQLRVANITEEAFTNEMNYDEHMSDAEASYANNHVPPDRRIALLDEASRKTRAEVDEKLQKVFKLVYLRLFFEVVLPILITLVGLILLLRFLCCGS